MKLPSLRNLLSGKVRHIAVFMIALAVCDVFVMTVVSRRSMSTERATGSGREFTLRELAEYNGTDAGKQVLLAMDGYVYDVTTGREKYYDPGKPYHMLAGADDTTLLHIAGGDIIARKYPVIGRLVP